MISAPRTADLGFIPALHLEMFPVRVLIIVVIIIMVIIMIII